VGHRSCGGRLLHGRRGLHLPGGHGIFIVITNLVVFTDLVNVVVVAVGGALFTIFCRTRGGIC
jgi:hypothetical protein